MALNAFRIILPVNVWWQIKIFLLLAITSLWSLIFQLHPVKLGSIDKVKWTVFVWRWYHRFVVLVLLMTLLGLISWSVKQRTHTSTEIIRSSLLASIMSRSWVLINFWMFFYNQWLIDKLSQDGCNIFYVVENVCGSGTCVLFTAFKRWRDVA